MQKAKNLPKLTWTNLCSRKTSFGAVQVVLSVLQDDGYAPVQTPEEADVILLNTCAIREHAESRVFSRLGIFKQLRAARQAENRSGIRLSMLGSKAHDSLMLLLGQVRPLRQIKQEVTSLARDISIRKTDPSAFTPVESKALSACHG